MKEQVLTIEQMQHLKELGVDTSKGGIYWVRFRAYNWFLSLHTDESLEVVLAFTLQDILDLLPKEIYTEKNELATLKIYFPNDGYWEFSYMGLHKCMEFFIEENIIDAAYEMLCWCAENGYIKTNKEG